METCTEDKLSEFIELQCANATKLNQLIKRQLDRPRKPQRQQANSFDPSILASKEKHKLNPQPKRHKPKTIE